MEQQANPQMTRDKLLDFFRALGHKDRLKIAGMLAQRPSTVVELARVLDLCETDVVHHLVRLEELGLVRTVSDESQAYAFDGGALLQLRKEVFRSQGARRARASERDWEQKLLDTFVVDGRLMGIPAQHKRRVAITKWLAARFETGVRYSEKEVNEIIRRVHHDSSSLRRYMIDYGFMQRDHGVYWRVPEQAE
jgi:hypothetical protein